MVWQAEQKGRKREKVGTVEGGGQFGGSEVSDGRAGTTDCDELNVLEKAGGVQLTQSEVAGPHAIPKRG